uniref:Coiled-coil domain containing 78 n=1 Tax=Myripristis murdjan TaxID=586833 RepID=A0A667Y0B0_9TELE
MESQDHKTSLIELEEQLRSLTEENLQLRDTNERLFTKVGYLESRLGHLARSKTDLSSRLVQSEEQKLKISKELVEVKIESNKMREQFEEETFELKNKILNQDGVITELEMERDKLRRELESAVARLHVGEKTGVDMTEEHVTLKRNYLALAEAHEREVAQSEQLGAELLSLAQAQDVLRRQLDEQQQSVAASTQGLHGELDRVRALISRMSHSRLNRPCMPPYEFIHVQLLGNQDEIRDMLEKMKNSYEEQQKRLEERVEMWPVSVQTSWISWLNVHVRFPLKALLCSQSQVKELEEENSKLQLQVKELSEEYRARLVCYLQDLAECIDGRGRSGKEKGPLAAGGMRAFVDSMLQDVRSSYRAREEQLASATRSYKKRLQRTTRTHHALLIAYRVQREQILSKPDSGLDPGLPEGHFSLDPIEQRGEADRELQRLRQDKARLEGELTAAREQVEQKRQISEESWLDIRKQLREITTSEGSEKERAVLLSRAAVAEAQVSELQDYVDNHLSRYKVEITRLRRLQGLEEPGRSQSAEASVPL